MMTTKQTMKNFDEWITPQEVREYSEIPAVQQRNDTRLAVDIARAKQYIITYTHNKFENIEEIPTSVKTALLLLAEAYAYNAVITSNEMKSETFDDYSYTVERNQINIDGLDIAALLDDYVITEPSNGIVFRMRKL